MLEVPAHVHQVQVEGAKQTRTSLIEAAIQPALAARTFGEVTQAVHQACCRLEQLEVMEGFQVTMDTSRDPLAPEGSLDVVIRGKEKGRFWARTGTEFGNSEGNAHTSATFRNVLGGGERVSISGSVGTRTRASNDITFTTPISANPNKVVDLSVFQQYQTFQTTSSHDQLFRGLNLRFKSNTPRFLSEVGYTALWRQMTDLGAQASPSIRQEGGHDVKSSVYFNLYNDQRDNPMLPTRGYLWRLNHELAGLAGLGGDVRFAKAEGQFQQCVPLAAGFHLTTSLRAGLIQPFDDSAAATTTSATRFPDRFLLGGPTSLRGFRPFGVGPRDHRDALGGDLYWATGLSLFTPLPVIGVSSLKGHLWANAGGLSTLAKGTSPLQTFTQSVSRPASSVGCGLVFFHGMVRLELNMCLPVTISAWDQPRKGWQFGLGVDFI
ncbi:hypothetical protein IWQ60_009082 [Tieghemiomyces parasiticus]|uniref:Bacterial surface antigen (D15) domain-containing protein n=1 Tax=Tieghemiomyces parasiticus TaxID=78921 RepID=A0A9W7ZVA2_9FUNG|nr:hypothetical protein IWQ60_009082 [Tieghemiomyces parasiticus]